MLLKKAGSLRDGINVQCTIAAGQAILAVVSPTKRGGTGVSGPTEPTPHHKRRRGLNNGSGLEVEFSAVITRAFSANYVIKVAGHRCS